MKGTFRTGEQGKKIFNGGQREVEDWAILQKLMAPRRIRRVKKSWRK